MDLDIQTMAVGTLQNNVNGLLETPGFIQALRAQGIEIIKKAVESVDAGAAERPLPAAAAANLAAAIDNAVAVDYDAFAGQVLAFLEPEYRDSFGSKRAWNELQEQVVNGLEALRQ